MSAGVEHDEHTEQEHEHRHRYAMPAGHAVLVIMIAFVAGTFLNADAMMHTAQSLPLGSTKRRVSVDVMRPIKFVADHLAITEPRTLFDEALGKHQKSVKDPFSGIANGTAPPTVPHPTTVPPSTTKTGATTKHDVTSTTKPAHHGPVHHVARFRPTAKRPLRIYVAGDSLSFEYGLAMGRLAASDPYMEMEGNVDYHVATGLARPDVFNWPAELATQMAARKPDVVVFMVGSNDDQSMRAPDGHVYHDFSPGWDREYARRVAAVMDEVIRSGRVVVWVGIPIISDPGRSAGYRHMNDIIRARVKARGDAYFIDTYGLFEDAHGGYQQYLPDASGHVVKMRANDNIHLERAGGDRLTAATATLLRRVYPAQR